MSAFEDAQRGDADALAGLVRSHIPLVHALSSRFSWKEDAFQAGCLGLVKAIRRFDEKRGVCFSTYAVPVILGEMKKADAEKVHWRTKRMLSCIRAAREKFISQFMREPTVQELALETGCPAEDMLLYLDRLRPKVSVEEEKETIGDPESGEWLERFLLKDMIARLPETERELLRLRFVLCVNQKEAAYRMHTSQSQISRMENRIFHQLRREWEEG